MRKRMFYYAWCNRTETDFVCTHCETIILDTAVGCQWCKRNQAISLAPGEKRPNPGLAAMQEGNRIAKETRPEKREAAPKPKTDRPPGYVNPGILAMREKNRLRKEAKLNGSRS